MIPPWINAPSAPSMEFAVGRLARPSMGKGRSWLLPEPLPRQGEGRVPADPNQGMRPIEPREQRLRGFSAIVNADRANDLRPGPRNGSPHPQGNERSTAENPTRRGLYRSS